MQKITDRQALFENSEHTSSEYLSAYNRSTEGEISLVEMWGVIWGRKRLISVVVVISTIIAIIYALVSPPVYRIESLVKLQGDYGNEATATLQSVAFIQDFIDQESLLAWILDEWDIQSGVWGAAENETPSLRQGAITIKENIIIKNQGQLTMIGLESTDPLRSVAMVNNMIQRLNDVVAEDALGKAEKKINHYKKQLFSFDSLFANRVVPEALSRTDKFLPENNDRNFSAVINYLQAQLMSSGSISERKRLIEEIQNNENIVMRARVERDEFALKVFDPASIPDKNEKIWPKPVFIIMLGFFGGCVVSLMLALILGFARDQK